MTSDSYSPGEPRTLERYPSGLRCGDRLRLIRDFAIRDHLDELAGRTHLANEVWTVLRGCASEPTVTWLAEPDGRLHTWDDSAILDTFAILQHAPDAGTLVILDHLPPWVDSLQSESKAAFRFALNRALRVSEIDDNGLVVIELGPEGDRTLGGFGNDIRVEAELIRRAV